MSEQSETMIVGKVIHVGDIFETEPGTAQALIEITQEQARKAPLYQKVKLVPDEDFIVIPRERVKRVFHLLKDSYEDFDLESYARDEAHNMLLDALRGKVRVGDINESNGNA